MDLSLEEKSKKKKVFIDGYHTVIHREDLLRFKGIESQYDTLKATAELFDEMVIQLISYKPSPEPSDVSDQIKIAIHAKTVCDFYMKKLRELK